MALFRQLIKDREGGTFIMVAASITLLVLSMAIVVDMGRIYTVRLKAQAALDAALLGAVTNTNNLQTETTRLFNANFPEQYLGARTSTIRASEISPGVFRANVSLSIPMSFMRVANRSRVSQTLTSEVTRSLEVTYNRRLEISLALDMTNSMAGNRIAALKLAARDLTDILFGEAEELQNLHISIVPYDSGVNVGPSRYDWVRNDCFENTPGGSADWSANCYLGRYTQDMATGTARLANRNSDGPRESSDENEPNGHNDLSDEPPMSERWKFRTPIHTSRLHFLENPYSSTPELSFAMNRKQDVHDKINQLHVATSDTRVPVGLMWAWYTLSNKWAGVWDPGRSELPADPNPLLDKAIVLMSDGGNSNRREYSCYGNGVYDPRFGINTCDNGGRLIEMTNDDTFLANLCETIKHQRQQITIYFVAIGAVSDVNTRRVITECASQPSLAFFVDDSGGGLNDRLRAVFHQIADDVLYNTIRLSR